MRLQKRKLFRLMFAGEIILFGIIYFFGSYGIYSLHHNNKELTEIQKEISTLEFEIKALKENILAIKTNPFYKEKIAREQLQMAKKGDVIYVFDEQEIIS